MGFLITWIVLAALWFGLSGHTDAVHLTFGFFSVTLVSAISSRHFTAGGSVRQGLQRVARLLLYVPWLLWQILLANVDVMLRVFGVREIHPCIIRFRPAMNSEFGQATLANSITLTPGTVTIDIVQGEFIVHALSRRAAAGVLNGAMARKAHAVEGGD